jgi:hypothetical protein
LHPVDRIDMLRFDPGRSVELFSFSLVEKRLLLFVGEFEDDGSCHDSYGFGESGRLTWLPSMLPTALWTGA